MTIEEIKKGKESKVPRGGGGIAAHKHKTWPLLRRQPTFYVVWGSCSPVPFARGRTEPFKGNLKEISAHS